MTGLAGYVQLRHLPGWIIDCRSSLDGSSMLFASASGDVLHVTPQQELRHLAHQGLGCLTVSGFGQAGFVSGGADGKVVHHLPGRAPVCVGQYDRWVNKVTALPDNELLLHVGDQVLKVQRGHEGAELLTEQPVVAVGYDDQTGLLACAHKDGIRQRYALSPKPHTSLASTTGSVKKIIYAPGASFMVASRFEPVLSCWDLGTGCEVSLGGYTNQVESFDFTDDGRWLITSSADCLLAWPVANGLPLRNVPLEFEAGGEECTVVAGKSGRNFFAAGFDGGSVLVVDSCTSKIIFRRRVADSQITSLAWSCCSSNLLYGSSDGACGWLSMQKILRQG